MLVHKEAVTGAVLAETGNASLILDIPQKTNVILLSKITHIPTDIVALPNHTHAIDKGTAL
jgi:hypothetical protein